jgi:hypothetical protein
MIKPTFWERFVTLAKRFVTWLSPKKSEVVTLPDGESSKYTGSFKSLYSHDLFKPDEQKTVKPERKKIDLSKTRYKFEQPSFAERVMRRFGR